MDDAAGSGGADPATRHANLGLAHREMLPGLGRRDRVLDMLEVVGLDRPVRPRRCVQAGTRGLMTLATPRAVVMAIIWRQYVRKACHFVAIRSADLALLAELAAREGQEPAMDDRHRFHIIDSMRREETAGLMAAQVIELVRDRLTPTDRDYDSKEDGGRAGGPAGGPADGRTDGRADGRMHWGGDTGQGVRTMRSDPVAEASRAGHRRLRV